ncbi:Leucine-rich repeat-containing protein 46 [Holothuria leucospilota]|uniref:Leucine-rich repeat-containing protein 46 n=1 Tax=Holothuria leucospilota TaxID=206669 RepID=A0A9Q1BGF8_HOLLE|nr:Leucine-rich repeat-containing protein 46 [Holothuria leucospilota]
MESVEVAEDDIIEKYGLQQNVSTKPMKITVSMIARRNLPSTSVASSEELVDKLLRLTHVRLDRENIGEIDNLEILGPTTNLYLQQNYIKKIENLDSLMNLRFLVLSGNQIEVIENLMLLENLQFLDLSDNLIKECDEDQLPRSLTILNLSNNPCCNNAGYRLKVIKALAHLKQLDGEMLSYIERREAGHDTSPGESDEGESDDDEADEENKESYHKALDEVLHLSANIIERSQARAMQYKSTHKSNMEKIEEMRSQLRQVMTSPRSKITPR